jgi:hypothetical protein
MGPGMLLCGLYQIYLAWVIAAHSAAHIWRLTAVSTCLLLCH